MNFSFGTTTKSVLAAAAIAAMSSSSAFAEEVTQGMSCDAAIKEFAMKEVVYVAEEAPGNTKQPLPVYAGVSVEKKDSLKCRDEGKSNPITVPTKDNPACIIAFSCGK